MFLCTHPKHGGRYNLCSHMLEGFERALGGDYAGFNPHIAFTGVGYECQVRCAACQEAAGAREISYHPLCIDCGQRFEALSEDMAKIIGLPEVRTIDAGMRFSHEATGARLPLDQLLAIAPAGDRGASWLALLASGEILRLDLGPARIETVAKIPEETLALADCRRLMACLSDWHRPSEVAFYGSPDGDLAGVVQTYGQKGSVVDLSEDRVTLMLDRGNYRVDDSMFPIAFFRRNGQQLLVHGSAWNRVDVSDPRSGKLLTERGPTDYLQESDRPVHFMDYFHGGLSVAPGCKWIASNGWAWQPAGVIIAWDLECWLSENIWESEDGPSRRSLGMRDYWDHPICWLDQETLAVWGFGETNVIPAVRIYDVPGEKMLKWFAGPAGSLVFDEYLFSFDKGEGTSIWDVETGNRLLYEPRLQPISYHYGAKQFLSLLEDGSVQLSYITNCG